MARPSAGGCVWLRMELGAICMLSECCVGELHTHVEPSWVCLLVFVFKKDSLRNLGWPRPGPLYVDLAGLRLKSHLSLSSVLSMC